MNNKEMRNNIFIFVLYYVFWFLLQLWKKYNPLKLIWSGDNQWIRPLGKFEEFLEKAHDRGYLLSSYCLTLNCVKPISIDDLTTALLHLQRKVPTLQLCIRTKKRGKQKWFCQMDRNKIDLQVKHNVDIDAEHFGMTKHQYAVEEGPLWCVRLIPEPKGTPCPMPELKTQFPYQCKLIIGFHHVITDGSSSMRICGHLMDLLNDVMGKRSIDDTVKLAYFADQDRTIELMMKAGLKMAFRPWEFRKYRDLALKMTKTELLFHQAYPPPVNNEPQQTLSIEYDFGEEDTARFMKKCKYEGVTLHSAFCTAINAAFVEMLLKGGFDRETFLIPNFHTINMRRYWQGDRPSEKGFGSHLGKMSLMSVCGRNIRDDFWDYARQFNANLKFGLEDEAPMKEIIALALTLPSSMDLDDYIDNASKSDANKPYYITTNMGNLNKIFTGEGKFVQATNLRRTTSSFATEFSHVMQTFRGRFLFGLDYEASKVSKETAQIHLDTIFRILRSVL